MERRAAHLLAITLGQRGLVASYIYLHFHYGQADTVSRLSASID